MTGKNREIRKILQKCDLQVNKLIRIEYGAYKLKSLQHGEVMEVKILDSLLKKLQKSTNQQLASDQKNLI
jgi:23S rRNA pseudouridine2605 synthase